jgi:hypothetical protein
MVLLVDDYRLKIIGKKIKNEKDIQYLYALLLLSIGYS